MFNKLFKPRYGTVELIFLTMAFEIKNMFIFIILVVIGLYLCQQIKFMLGYYE